MKYTNIGTSNLEVSSICLGTWVFGGDCWGEVDDAVSARVVEAAIDKGINFIDTAPIYGSGRSEEVIGKAIKGKRDSLVIATKCGLKIKGKGIAVDLSPEFIRLEIENSLRRLRVETIDLYQCHWPDENTPFSETFSELEKLISEGKIKYIGISNFDADQTKRALENSQVITNQVQYSLLDRRIEETLMPVCKEGNVSILPYGALGGGMLTGKHKEPPEIKKGDVKDFFYKYYKEPYWSKARQLVSFLEEVAKEHNASASEVAINWMLSHELVPSCIAGCRTPSQLDQNIKAADWELTEGDLNKIQSEYERIF